MTWRWLPCAIAAAGCSASSPPLATRAAPLGHELAIDDVIGGWQWLLSSDDAASATRSTERELWRFRRVPGTLGQLTGRYVRHVAIHSSDGATFNCNQRAHYTQRAVFELDVELTDQGLSLRERDYRYEPSPCDHGFRHTTTYAATLGRGRITLTWDGGSQELLQLDRHDRELPDDPWPAAPSVAGPWRWSAVSYDDDGNLRSEHEWWELTMRNDRQIDATYRRRVIVDQRDGQAIPCARASRWSFDDAFVLVGQREDEHWRFHEVAAEPGDHPCLRTTPQRTLDEATGEQLGEHLVLEWRGKRRQVLYRGAGE